MNSYKQLLISIWSKLMRVDTLIFMLSLYIFFLPYVKLGIPVVNYRLSLPDIVLVGTAMMVLLKFFEGFPIKIDKAFFPALLVVPIFVIFLLPSSFKSENSKLFIVELLPYIHGFMTLVIFLIIFSSMKQLTIDFFINIYLAAFFVSIIPALLSFCWNFQEPILRMFFNDAQKYQFLCVSPNQYTFFVLTAVLCSFLNEKLPAPVRVLILIFSGMVIFMSGSRAGSILFLLLVGYSVITMLLKIFQKQIRRVNVLTIICLFLIFISFVMPYLKYKFWNTVRSLSGISYILKGKFGDEYRQMQFKQALQQFFSSPWIGIGLGNFMKFSPDGHEIHNSFLSILVESGISGFIGLIIMQLFLLLLIIKSDRFLGIKVSGLLILSASYLYMFAHHIFRERWLWLLYIILIVYFSAIRRKNRCAE